MPQLHFYVPQEIADRIIKEAAASQVSVSRYLADLVKREMAPDWPAGYFEEVVGCWQGEPLQRPFQDEFEARESLDPH